MRHLKQVIAAGIFALSLTVGAGLANDAVARDDIPRGGDGIQQACRDYQQRAKSLVAEYGNEATTDERRSEILRELKQIGRDWDTLCRYRYGDIFLEVSEPDGSSHHPGIDEAPNWETYRGY